MARYFYRVLLLVVFAWTSSSFAAEAKKRPTVCLNMIVKNEKDVITRCLSSVLPIIDYWVIVDTGSTDGTQQVIKDYMREKGVPGDLYERPWVNFGHNRDEALQLAKNTADYLFFIDADEYLEYDPGFKLPYLDKDYYNVTIKHSGSIYDRIKLIATRLPSKWEGVLHEAVVLPPTSNFGTLTGIHNIYTVEGARSKDPLKYQKDAEILEAALKKEPNNSRYVFYLAQSYRDAKNYPKALETYQKRVDLGGWEEEVFYSLFQIAVIQEALDMPSETVLGSFQKAYQYRKSRVEPLYHIAQYLRVKKGDFQGGYLVAKAAQSQTFSPDKLFIQKWVYDYGIPLELSVCAYWIGKYEECQKLSLAMLKNPDLPDDIRNLVEKNLEFANAKIIEEVLSKSTTAKS